MEIELTGADGGLPRCGAEGALPFLPGLKTPIRIKVFYKLNFLTVIFFLSISIFRQ